MRAILIIIVTLAALAGAFFAVVAWQSKPESVQGQSAQTRPSPAAASLPATRPQSSPDSRQIVGEGENPWVQSFDAKTGELANEFRAKRYTPKEGDVVEVTAPEARFYLGRGEETQLLLIRGETGKVIVPSAGQDKLNTTAGSPTKGDLQKVRIELYNRVGDAQPQIICSMPNASFDNDQFLIFTDAFQDEQGNAVPGDQVPVQITGDYEFDGKGLEIRWNERDRRLQSLEIAHGNRLVIHDIQTLKLGGACAGIVPLPEALVQADPKAIPPTATATKKKKKKKPVKPVPGKTEIQRDRTNPVYRAQFLEKVTIYEGEKQIGQADQLAVDFLMNLSKESATQPSTQPNDPATAPTPKPTTQPSRRKPAHEQQDVQGPITVRWTGKLVVTQLADPDEAPESGETNIALIGSPVKVERNGSQIVGAKITYSTGDSSFSATGDETTPQVLLTDPRGVKITTTSIDYGGVGELAYLEGKSHAEIPVEAKDSSTPSQIITASWTDSCMLNLVGDSVDALQIQDADLHGDVKINHPQMNGRSDALHLAFAAEDSISTTQPSMTVKSLTATGGVDYSIISEDQQRQAIKTDALTVHAGKTPSGELYASSLNAVGNVHTQDPERELFAGRLEVKLSPTAQATTQPTSDFAQSDFTVDSLRAEENVRIATNKGQTATANRLTFATKGGSRQVELIGSPNAKVSDSETTITGPIIRFDPDAGNASIVGAGSLDAVQKSADGTPRKIAANWEGDLQLRGKENLATINGPVVLSAPSDDGSTNTAVGQRLIIQLADAPATQPAIAKRSAMGDVSALSNKVIESYSLQDRVEIRSVLSDASGAMLRRIHLFGDRVNFEQSTQKVVIPGGGRMLVEDNRTDPTPSTQPTLLGSGNLRGATAFQWQRELTYDEAAGRVEFNGSVRVVHQGTAETPFEVSAETISADIARGEGAKLEQGKVDVKRLTAYGSVMFVSKDIQFQADEVIYDPQTHRLTARAMPGRFAELFHQSGVSRGSFTELVFNTQTNATESMKDFRATVAR